MSPNNGILFKEVLMRNFLNNPLSSYSLINVRFSLLQTKHLVKNIIVLLLVFKILAFILSVFFLRL